MLHAAVVKHPARTAVIGGGRSLTYRELSDRVASLANWLVAAGVRPGDHVALFLEKTPEMIVAYLAVNAAGGIVAPINYRLSETEIRQSVDLVSPRVVIAADSQLPVLEMLFAAGGPRRLVVGADGGGAEWTAAIASRAGCFPDVTVTDATVSYLNFTSGSTGLPKAAFATHGNLYWNTRASVESFDLTPDDVHLIMFPVFVHPHELLARPLYLGGTTVLVDSMAPKAIAEAIVANRVTCVMAVASVYASLVRYHQLHPFDMSSVRLAESGGMYVTGELAGAFRERFGFDIRPVWGSTETAGVALANDIRGPVQPGAAGRPCPHYTIRLLREDGSEVAPGEEGEMVVSGPAVSSGYYRNPGETAAQFKGGCFHTRDIFRRDADGYLHFVGRWSGMIKVAGLKVFPLEVENALRAHPAVDEAAVIGVKARTQGEVVKAVVQLRSGAQATPEDLRRHCVGLLADYKVPRAIEIVGELPRTIGGKINYRALK